MNITIKKRRMQDRGTGSDFLFRVLCILFAAYVVVYPLEINVLFKSIMFAIYLVMLLIVARCFCQRTVPLVDFLLQFLVILLVVLEFICYDIPLNVSSIQSIFCYLLLVVLMIAHNGFVCTKRTHDDLFRTCVLVTLVLSAYSFLPFAYYHRETHEVGIYLTLNLDNSNFTGIVLFFLFTVLWSERKNRKCKLLLYALMAYLVYMIYLTNSRTCLATTAMLIAYTILFSKKTIPKWMIVVILVIPFVFVPVYTYLSEQGSDTILFMGKRIFSGRQDIYARYLAYMQEPIYQMFGNMKEVFFLNAGNGPLALYCSTGIFATAAFYLLHIRQLLKSRQNAQSVVARSALVALLSFAIHTCAESSMVLGGIVSLFTYFSLFVLTHDTMPEQGSAS